MIKPKIVLFCLIVSIQLAHGQNYFDKKVTLISEKITLKAALESISNQAGCVFSYNPLVLNDAKILQSLNFENQKLSSVLRKLLPVDVEFLQQGKYLVMQRKESVKQAQKTPKSVSKIDKNPGNVALVIPTVNEQSQFDYALNVRDSVVYIIPARFVPIEIQTSPFEKSNTLSTLTIIPDSAMLKRVRLQQFLLKHVDFQCGISSSSPLSSVLLQAGLYGVYAEFSVSTDNNNSYRLGYGLGYSYNFGNNAGVSLQLLQHQLFAGKSYDLGVRAVLTRADALFVYAISRNFNLFIGPSFFKTQSSYVDANTDLGTSYGAGLLVGVRLDIVQSIFNKK